MLRGERPALRLTHPDVCRRAVARPSGAGAGIVASTGDAGGDGAGRLALPPLRHPVEVRTTLNRPSELINI
jgi:hypothetical protein